VKLLKGKLGKVLLPLFLFTIFVVVPFVSIGAIWVQHVALLPGTAVVLSSDTAAIDRFMAAALKPYYGDRVGICNGVNDHVEIQAALDAVRDVKLSVGQFNCELTIDILYSEQTLKGCGRNTTLTTSTADLIFLSAVGGNGTELTGIVISDLQMDGDDVSDCGIYFEYVDYSFIQNVYSRGHTSGTGTYRAGIYLRNSDFNTVIGNTCQGNGYNGIRLGTSNNNTVSSNTCQGNGSCGIYLGTSSDNTVSSNTCQGNDHSGIYLDASSDNTVSSNTCHENASCGIYLGTSSDNTVSSNTCQGNDHNGIYLNASSDNTVTGNTCRGNIIYGGIFLATSSDNTITGNTCQGNSNYGICLDSSSHNTISGNTCQGNGYNGIYLSVSSDNTISGNTCIANSQLSTNTDDDIIVAGNSDYNNIQGNTCRAGTLTNKPRYGINIADATGDGNLVTNNDLYDDGFGTGSFNDAGTGTVTVAGNRV